MDKSLFRTSLGALLVSAVLISTAQAQGNGNGFFPSGNYQSPLPAAILPTEETLDHPGSGLNICLLKTQPGLEWNASLLYLQPSSGNLIYATLVNPYPFLTPSWRDQAVRPGLSPAFNVGLRYYFGGGGDMQLAWTHLNTDDTSTAIANPSQISVPSLGLTTGLQALGPSYLIGPPPPFSTATAVAQFWYDAVNWDAGLWLGAGNHVQMRFFAGLQGTRINQTLSTHFLSPDGSIAFTDASKSVFTGVGPRLGIDLHYIVGNFDLLGGIAGSILVGQMQGHIDFFSLSPTVAANGLALNSQSLTSPDTTKVIPAVDARLGASYAIPIGQSGILKCEAGYQAAAYIGAINQYSLSEVSNPVSPLFEGNAAVFLRTAVEYQSNFLVHGPYGKLSLQF